MSADAKSEAEARLKEARRLMQSLPNLGGAARRRVEAELFGAYWEQYQRLLESGEVQQNAPAYQRVMNQRPRRE